MPPKQKRETEAETKTEYVVLDFANSGTSVFIEGKVYTTCASLDHAWSRFRWEVKNGRFTRAPGHCYKIVDRGGEVHTKHLDRMRRTIAFSLWVADLKAKGGSLPVCQFLIC